MTKEGAASLKSALYLLIRKISTSHYDSEKYPKCQPPKNPKIYQTERYCMYPRGQTLFSAKFMDRFRPRSIEAVTLCRLNSARFRLASNPPKRLFQLPCRELNHRRAAVGAGAWGLARFQLVDQFLHFQVAEELTGFDGGPFADHLDHACF